MENKNTEPGQENIELGPELICNCEDEFKTTFCPIHDVQGMNSVNQKFGEELVNTITDIYIIPERMRIWEGFVFKCPSCGKESVMVNQDMAVNGMGICSNGACGKKAIIHSKIVTDFVNQLSQKGKKNV